MGDDILSVRQIRKLGIEATLARIPKGVDYYLTIDIDGFDPVHRPRHRAPPRTAGSSTTKSSN